MCASFTGFMVQDKRVLDVTLEVQSFSIDKHNLDEPIEDQLQFSWGP